MKTPKRLRLGMSTNNHSKTPWHVGGGTAAAGGMNDWKAAELINTAKNDCLNIEWTDAYWCDGFTFRRMLDGRLTPFAAVYWNPGAQLWDVYNLADEEDETLIRRHCNHFQSINEVRRLQAELFGWEDAYGKPVVEVTQGYSRRDYSHTCWRLAQ